MGIYYHYVNDSKKCYFPIDPTGVEVKGSFIGRNIGSRAFHYLVMENDSSATGTPDHPLLGGWIGDRAYLTGDDYGREFDQVVASYENISQAILEMLATVSPFDFIHDGRVSWFTALVENGGEGVRISSEMAASILAAYENEHAAYPDDELERLIEGLKKLL